MDGKNVTELTEISNLNDDDAMLVGQSNSLKRISFANVKTLFWTIINVVSNLATSAKNGLMAAVDKAKLDAMSDTLKNKTVSDSVVDSSDIIVSGKAVNGALADFVNYNISTATSLDNAIPTVSQKYKKCRFRGTVNSIDGIWLIETYNTQHDSNNNLYLYTQFAYQLKADTVIGSKFIRQGYSSDKGVTNTWATWEKLATSSDLESYTQNSLTLSNCDSSSDVKYTKHDGLCTVEGYIKLSSALALGSSVIIGYMPANYRPKKDISFPIRQVIGGATQHAFINITANDGTIRVENPSNSSGATVLYSTFGISFRN